MAFKDMIFKTWLKRPCTRCETKEHLEGVCWRHTKLYYIRTGEKLKTNFARHPLLCKECLSHVLSLAH